MAESWTEMADEVQQEENEDTVLSMVDVLQESEELEEEATAVLGDSDDKYCTYPLGYRGRQALYACATCTSASTESAGVCLACSYECHEGHQLYELYTKRNFRCDCGNSKFGSMQCKLIEKDATNPDNKYNQNFRGVYCICSRPYPDPEDEIEDEMIQCVVCEDWFHGRHLGDVRVPESNDYQEMVCAQCMQGACDFLWYYAITSKEVKIEKEESCLDVEVENVAKNQPVSDSGNKEHAELYLCQGPATSDTKPYVTSDQKPAASQPAPDHPSTDNATSTDTKNTVPVNEVPPTTENVNPEQSESMTVHQDSKDLDITQTQASAAAATVSGGEASTSASTVVATSHNGQRQQEHVAGDVCRLRELKAREVEKKSHATFWPSGWRSKLCTCQDCKMLYESRHVSFLMDVADTVLAYELRGKVKHAGTSQYQMGMEALTTLNRVQQVEVIHEYNDLKASLRDYLQSFANQGKVVKRQDIDEFFSDMQSRKRQRVGVGNPQYFCR